VTLFDLIGQILSQSTALVSVAVVAILVSPIILVVFALVRVITKSKSIKIGKWLSANSDGKDEKPGYISVGDALLVWHKISDNNEKKFAMLYSESLEDEMAHSEESLSEARAHIETEIIKFLRRQGLFDGAEFDIPEYRNALAILLSITRKTLNILRYSFKRNHLHRYEGKMQDYTLYVSTKIDSVVIAIENIFESFFIENRIEKADFWVFYKDVVIPAFTTSVEKTYDKALEISCETQKEAARLDSELANLYISQYGVSEEDLRKYGILKE
jgi:hypothetical protein